MSEQQHRWSGQSVAGRYTLGNYLGGTQHSAVFATEIVHARAQKGAIKLIPAAVVDAERQLSCWKWVSQLVHANLLKILDYGKGELDGAGYLFGVAELWKEDASEIRPDVPL